MKTLNEHVSSKNVTKLPLHGKLGVNGGGTYPYGVWQNEELAFVSLRFIAGFDVDTDHLDRE
ncbi:hypothetical protein [Bacillus sp. FJAT-28004]|uniref:hypothetical protein n=1 Tax=Bacillus sp. FJAT-28004 TaxID=1679165 RepID=UPI0006B67036|nr:hypothetical protein [Bacillus sp. FJAT-28004]